VTCHALPQYDGHGGIGLERDGPHATLGEGDCGLTGADADVEGCGIGGGEGDHVIDQRDGIARAHPLVIGRDLAEHQRLLPVPSHGPELSRVFGLAPIW
jgi:hypothetical protein